MRRGRRGRTQGSQRLRGFRIAVSVVWRSKNLRRSPAADRSFKGRPKCDRSAGAHNLRAGLGGHSTRCTEARELTRIRGEASQEPHEHDARLPGPCAINRPRADDRRSALGRAQEQDSIRLRGRKAGRRVEAAPVFMRSLNLLKLAESRSAGPALLRGGSVSAAAPTGKLRTEADCLSRPTARVPSRL